jgi:hypothetical protein
MKPANRAASVFVLTVLAALLFIILFGKKERPAQ